MEATAGNLQQRDDLSSSMTRANNQDFNFNGNHYLMNRAPDYFVYLHNVSEQNFEVSRPPLIRKMTLVGRRGTEKVTACARFPQPLLTPNGNVDSNEITIIPMDARRFCMDIINPDNLGLDQNAVIKNPTNIGNDLGKKGIFWSLNSIATSDEVEGAVKRMEAYYNHLLEQARTVEVSNPAGLKDTLTPEHHAAADYYGVETSWHGKRSRPMDCPNCGDRVKAGIAFHKTDEGTLCIIDWKRAVSSGVRTKQQAIDAGAPGFEAAPEPVKASAPKSNIPTEK